MAISTYAELQTALTNWLARSDQTARYPEWIAMAEADMRRDLRKRVVREALTLNSNAVSLPATCQELRSVRFNTSSLQHSLDLRSHSALDALRRTGSGRPHYAAVLNNVLLLDIDPDSDYTAEIVYYELLVALATTPTNSTLTESPDIYLYGSLKHSAPFLEHDERVATWKSLYDEAVAKENIRREEAELGAAPMSVGLPVVF